MRAGCVTYKRRFDLPSMGTDCKVNLTEHEEIGITIFLDEGDKQKGVTADTAFELARTWVMDKAENSKLLKTINEKSE